MTEERLKEIAATIWKDCANAHRMYPDNKHTFADYWDRSKEGLKLLSEEVSPGALKASLIACLNKGKELGLLELVYSVEDTVHEMLLAIND